MLLSAVSVLVDAQSSSEIPEGLTNNPVYETLVRPLHSRAAETWTTVKKKTMKEDRVYSKGKYFA